MQEQHLMPATPGTEHKHQNLWHFENKFRPLSKLAIDSSVGIFFPLQSSTTFFWPLSNHKVCVAQAHTKKAEQRRRQRRARRRGNFDKIWPACHWLPQGGSAESGQGRATRPEALFVADGSQLMSYLSQSPVTIACTGEKQGEEGSGGRILITIRGENRAEKRLVWWCSRCQTPEVQLWALCLVVF